MAKKKKTAVWLSCMLTVLAALAAWAAKDRSGRRAKAMLYRLELPCHDREDRPISAQALSAYVSKLAREADCGLADGPPPTENAQRLTYFLLSTDAEKTAAMPAKIQQAFNLPFCFCTLEKRP